MYLHGRMEVVTVTPTLHSADALDAGDVIFNLTELSGILPPDSFRGMLMSATILDKANQGIETDLVLLKTNLGGETLGALDGAPDITDTEAEQIIRPINFPAAAWTAFGAVNKFGSVANINHIIKGASQSLWLAGITRGTPTYSASALVISVGVLWL